MKYLLPILFILGIFLLSGCGFGTQPATTIDGDDHPHTGDEGPDHHDDDESDLGVQADDSDIDSGDTNGDITAEVKEFQMTAKKWDFTPDTITVNEGDTVKLVIESIDVDHGFAISDFGVNERLEPGKTVTVEFIADKSGTFTFFCNVFCGSGHSHMEGTLIVN